MRPRVVLVSILCLIGLGIAGGAGSVGAVGDELPDNCGDAPVVKPGFVNGTIDTPEDVDVFRVTVEKADFLAVTVTVPESERNMGIYHSEQGVRTSLSSFNPLSAREYSDSGILGGFSYDDPNDPSILMPVSYKAFAEESGEMCIALYERSDRAEFPYDYSVRFAKNEEPAWWQADQQLDPDPYTPYVKESLADPPDVRSTTAVPTATPTTSQAPTTTPTPPHTETSISTPTETPAAGTTNDGGGGAAGTTSSSGPGFGPLTVLLALGVVTRRYLT